MKRFANAVLIVLFLSVTGCFTMKYAAPDENSVVLATEDAKTSFKKSVKVWYALYGAVPITSNSPANIIAENKLKKVKVTTKIELIDYVIAAFTGIATIVPATMTIEGSR